MVLRDNVFVERVLPGSMIRQLSSAEMDHYRRPFVNPGEDRRSTLTWPRQIPLDGEPADVAKLSATTVDGWRRAKCRNCTFIPSLAHSTMALSASFAAPGRIKRKSRERHPFRPGRQSERDRRGRRQFRTVPSPPIAGQLES